MVLNPNIGTSSIEIDKIDNNALKNSSVKQADGFVFYIFVNIEVLGAAFAIMCSSERMY